MDQPDESHKYIVLPGEAIERLPDEWKQYFNGLKEKGEIAIKVADQNLKVLNRLLNAIPEMMSLRYIHHRLSSTEFKATIEWTLENEMLTLAFVTAYVRLIEGGIGSGVSRDTLPPSLRPVYDRIIELRNKRYAHNAGHDSVSANLRVEFDGNSFYINPDINVGFHIGGAREWKELVVFLDGLMFERLQIQLATLKEKTGHEWNFPSGPAPDWISGEAKDAKATPE